MNERPFQGPLPTDKFWDVGRAWTRPIPRGIPGIAIFGAWAAIQILAVRRHRQWVFDVLRPAEVEEETFRLSLYPVLQAEADLRLLLRHEEVKELERYWAVPRDPNWIVGETAYYTRYMEPTTTQVARWN